MFYMDAFNPKIKISTRVCLNDREDLATHYTPGIGEVVKAIANDPEKASEYTLKRDSIAIISNGSAILGLGNLGPKPMLPVLEGKALILKRFGRVNPFPLALKADKEELIKAAHMFAPTFALIMVEDVKAPDSFEIQERLEKELEIPAFNDDMYGTAVVTGAALLNALKLVKKENPKIVMLGAGAAGLSVARLLYDLGFKDVWIFDSKGVLTPERQDLNPQKRKIAELFNKPPIEFKEALKGADVFLGFSKGNLLTAEDIKLMNKDAIIFALANPVPEISKEEAFKAPNVAIYANGRSDCKNQINNSIAFPGIITGIVEAKAKRFTPKVLPDIARFIAQYHHPKKDNLLPDMFDRMFHSSLADYVKNLCSNKCGGMVV
ncbi:MAG: NADP-dependent malic enzyme [Candidatus Micrarchaeota archaeon]|nr:NADP-dependent malic enzyme [Candidatus Micrarchaeota archaeon]